MLRKQRRLQTKQRRLGEEEKARGQQLPTQQQLKALMRLLVVGAGRYMSMRRLKTGSDVMLASHGGTFGVLVSTGGWRRMKNGFVTDMSDT